MSTGTNFIGYRSTRSSKATDATADVAAEPVDFSTAIRSGLAPDGGLFCPVEIPKLADLSGIDPHDYVSVARKVMWPYVEGSIEQDAFNTIVGEAYRSFRHPDICPVIDLGGGHHLLDLTQGPTLAFKDVALQLVGRLLDHLLTQANERVVVIGATSGDTGSAAIEALAGRDRVTVVMLHPNGRVSEVQRRQMTTVNVPNIHNLAVEGNFDDCQDLVKASFAATEITNVHQLSAVNSINWARVMAQMVYYVTAARTVAPDGGPVSFSVPTGNFGNVLSGWYAKRMGLPVDQLVVASNRNDIMTRYFSTGSLDAHEVVPTLSPSMDIQISSNFERLLWEASARDGEAVADLIGRFRSTGSAEVPAVWHEAITAEFSAGRLDDDGTLAEIARVHDEFGLVIDPHTAVGLAAARQHHRDRSIPMVTLATADPAKFGDAVKRATGVDPQLPDHLAELHARTEHYDVVENSIESITDWFERL